MITWRELGLQELGMSNIDRILRNLPVESLIEDSILKKETKMGMNGAVMVDTGRYTGRSPKDKYFVSENTSKDNIWWGSVNQKIDTETFDYLYKNVISYYNHADDSNTYIFDGFAGADPDYRISVRIIAKKAWQVLFAQNMFIRPTAEELKDFTPDFTIINASEVSNERYEKHKMNSDTFICFNLEKRVCIIGGTEYGGEIKKGIFSVLNYMLPLRGVLSMHCSSNVDLNGENPALFFGLSGTGKTTLSTDPNRPLIGDDEHGWSDNGIFNFEGGCYAKVINLDQEAEPDIYNAIRHGALLENVVFDERTRVVDFTDSSKTENTRVSYPLEFIENSLCAQGLSSMTGHPKTIIFLACDAYGVLPPISKLTNDQAMYYFISGYTAKVAGTERGITEPQATFSPCFGGPFLTLHPLKYADLLKEKIIKHDSKVYLVNTGWIGGSATEGAKRISIQNTRAMITAILDGSIENAEFETLPLLNLSVPLTLKGVKSEILNPRKAWDDPEEYDKMLSHLAKLITENFKKYGLAVKHLETAGPKLSK
ncbi:MAG: phosphoenolpyruvate carboxykinase (ATP) [Candidatus Marinimicrobia bacterium]|nr:phosphoenolpyruvate carboxykinase (ATP) [Candidatus Neomarinimicrobiota bacterium]